MSVNYVVASWSGNRAGMHFDDSYIQTHLKKLNKIKKNVDQITIGWPDNPDERKDHTDFMNNLDGRKLDDGTPIVVMKQINSGGSYGQWSRAYEKYRTSFDHYIFIEDDYVPCQDNFDQALIDMFEKRNKKDKCGYLCGLVFDESGRYGRQATCHAAISNGITNSEVLEHVWEQFSEIPFDRNHIYRSQVIFSKGFIECGYLLKDYLDEYRCMFFQHNEFMRIYGDQNKKDLIVPVQYEPGKKQEFIYYKEFEKPKSPLPQRSLNQSPLQSSSKIYLQKNNSRYNRS